jgi:hypothetical protein
MTPGEREREIARFILEEARSHNVRVGTDGPDLLIGAPPGLPRAVWIAFRDAILEHRDAIIDHIQRAGADA